MKNPLMDMNKFQEDRLSAQITDIVQMVNAVAETDIASMPEHVFVAMFLPLFAGDEQRQYAADLRSWANFAGGPYRKVHIVKEGQILFTVPPLFDRSAIDPIKDSDGLSSIAHVVASAEQYAAMSPIQGSHYLNSELAKRALVLQVPTNVLQNIEIWNSIFTRYGRPPVMALEQSAPVEASQDKDKPDYDFEPL